LYLTVPVLASANARQAARVVTARQQKDKGDTIMPSPFRLDFSHTLGLVALAPTVLGAGMIAAITMAHADTVETARVTVHPGESPIRVRHRIELAALQVCGGGWASAPEVNRVVRASRCWTDAVNGALAQVPQRTVGAR
jgi:hypothetical protein